MNGSQRKVIRSLVFSSQDLILLLLSHLVTSPQNYILLKKKKDIFTNSKPWGLKIAF